MNARIAKVLAKAKATLQYEIGTDPVELAQAKARKAATNAEGLSKMTIRTAQNLSAASVRLAIVAKHYSAMAEEFKHLEETTPRSSEATTTAAVLKMKAGPAKPAFPVSGKDA